MDIDVSWMAWTWPTAYFFISIALMLLAMTVWQLVSPSIERVGILGIPTTRGDRVFITLLGTAFINLAWLGIIGHGQWWALVVAAVFALAVFRWV
jgi:predicted small integral membrane protein